MKERGSLAFEHIKAEGGAQHTDEKDVALRDGEVEFAGHEGEHGDPINPNERVDKVDDKALDEDGATTRYFGVHKIKNAGIPHKEDKFAKM